MMERQELPVQRTRILVDSFGMIIVRRAFPSVCRPKPFVSPFGMNWIKSELLGEGLAPRQPG